MDWFSKRKNAALLCFGIGGVLALLLIIYAPVRMYTLVLDGGELQEMALLCAAPERSDELVYVKDEQVCAQVVKAMEGISLRRVRSAPYVSIREPIYIVKPSLMSGGMATGFTVDAEGAVYCGHVQYRTLDKEDGAVLYAAMEQIWQQMKK